MPLALAVALTLAVAVALAVALALALALPWRSSLLGERAQAAEGGEPLGGEEQGARDAPDAPDGLGAGLTPGAWVDDPPAAAVTVAVAVVVVVEVVAPWLVVTEAGVEAEAGVEPLLLAEPPTSPLAAPLAVPVAVPVTEPLAERVRRRVGDICWRRRACSRSRYVVMVWMEARLDLMRAAFGVVLSVLFSVLFSVPFPVVLSAVVVVVFAVTGVLSTPVLEVCFGEVIGVLLVDGCC